MSRNVAPYPLPLDEVQRLAALRRYRILDTPAEPAFDRLAQLAARLFQAPIALIGFVDAERQWMKACVGADLRETRREHTFCTHTILHDELLVVPDATQDPRFAQLPAVTGAPGIRFYAGANLITDDGFRVGTLCVVDTQPRPRPPDAQLQELKDLAAIAVKLLELHLANLHLQEAERELTTLMNHASDIIYRHDLSGKITAINRACEQLTGYRREELLGRNVLELVAPESRPLLQALLEAQDLSMAKDLSTLEVAILTKSNERLTLEVSPRLVYQGEVPIGVQGIARDISERKRMELALRESEERFRVMVETSGDVLYRLRHDTMRYDYLSPGIEQLTGYLPDELMHGGLLPLIERIEPISASERGLSREAFVARWRAGQLSEYRADYLIRCKDGSRRWLSDHSYPWRDASGRLLGAVGVLADINRRKRAELLERDRNRVLEQIVNNAPLADILGELVALIETHQPDTIASVQLRRGRKLFTAVAPRLPQSFAELLAPGLPIRPDAGACGSAAYHRRRVISDIASDPHWQRYREAALACGLRTCWAAPILSAKGELLGTFAMYYTTPKPPSREAIALLESVVNLAAIAIERQQLTEQLTHQAQHDPLTGLANRLTFEVQFKQALQRAQRHGERLALLFIDLNDFKTINDSLGHHVGDLLLKAVARRLRQSVRRSDTVARLGGDEFVLILNDITCASAAQLVADKLAAAMAAPFVIKEHTLHLSASIGVSLYPDDGSDAEALMQRADSLMYQVKQRYKVQG